MSRSYQEILEILCSEITPLTHTGTQEIFLLKPTKEARLAYEVLIACGFNARLYEEADGAKLYVSTADKNPNDRFDAAYGYGLTLKQILAALPADSNTVISFANTAHGRQIAIHFPSQSPAASKISSPDEPQQAPETLRKHAKAPERQKAGFSISGLKVEKEPDIFSGGPALAKQYPFGIKPPVDETNHESMRRKMLNYFVGNLSASFYAFFSMLTLLCIIITVYVMLKTYYCNDFLTPGRKNPNWYCNVGPG
jgi:hypothetical protein